MSINANVTIYTTRYCGYCMAAKDLLSRKKVRFTEIGADGRPDLRAWLAKVSGQRTVPQVFINGRPVGGFTDVSALDEDGELDVMLAAAPDPNAPALPV